MSVTEKESTPRPQQEDSGDLVLRFEGEPAEIAAQTFIGSLLSVTGILHELQVDQVPGYKLDVRIRAPRRGSFIVHLVLSPETREPLTKLLDPDTLKIIAALITAFGAILGLRKHLKKEPPKEVTNTAEGDVVVKNNEGSTIVVDRRVFNTYNHNQNIHTHIDRTFETLESDPKITGFEVRDRENRPIFVAERNEFSELTEAYPALEAGAKTNIERTKLSIVKVSFEKKLKWDFIYQGHRISAYVVDQPFFDGIDKGVESFAKGDSLDVDLQIDQVFDESLNVYVNKEYRVLRVYSHVKRAPQARFDFE